MNVVYVKCVVKGLTTGGTDIRQCAISFVSITVVKTSILDIPVGIYMQKYVCTLITSNTHTCNTY